MTKILSLKAALSTLATLIASSTLLSLATSIIA